MFRRFGSRVTVVELMEQIVPREDEDVAEALQQALEAEGIRFHLSATASRVNQTATGLEMTIWRFCSSGGQFTTGRPGLC